MSTENDIDRFEAYLANRLPAQERHAFEEQLAKDIALAAAFRDFRAAHDLVVLAGERDLKEKLHAIHTDVTKARTGRVIQMRGWLGIAASVLVVLAAAYLFFGRVQSPQDLYAEHFSPYPAPDLMRSGGSEASQAWARFGAAYAAHRYDEALVTLNSIAPDAVPAYLLSFYRGQCELLKEPPDPQAAIEAFEEVLATYNEMQVLAHWYIGLAALKAGDASLAREHFGAIAKPGGYKAAEARTLLEELGDP